MYKRIHNQFGTAGMILSVVAIVLALAGGAVAASGGKPGPRGKTGKTGKTGPQGPQGPAGTNGTNGKDGTNGTNGTNGTDGVSPLGTAFAGNANGCTEGGVKFEGKNTTVACNGAKGSNGKNVVTTNIPSGGAGLEGHCATVGGTRFQVEGSATKEFVCNGEKGAEGNIKATLGSGKTETGAWAYGNTSVAGNINVALPFAIPLAAEIEPEKAHYIYTTGKELLLSEEGEIEEVPSTHCLGTAASPTAPAGEMCVYAAKQTGALNTGIFVCSFNIASAGESSPLGALAGKTGAHLTVGLFSGSSEGWGTYAVTAP